MEECEKNMKLIKIFDVDAKVEIYQKNETKNCVTILLGQHYIIRLAETYPAQIRAKTSPPYAPILDRTCKIVCSSRLERLVSGGGRAHGGR
jgi:hypothetical protein